MLAAAFAGFQAKAANVQARSARDQLELTEQVRRDQAQPYVYVDIRPDEHVPMKIMVVIQNTGMTVARNIRVKLDPPLQSQAKPDFETVLNGGTISALAPGRKMQWFFDVGHQIFSSATASRQYAVAIDAEGPFGPLEQLTYNIDLDDLRQSDAASHPLHKLSDEVKAIRQVLERKLR
jgi:hypothetical protein